MSYNAQISFKSINDLKDIFPFLSRFKQVTIENLDKIAEDEFIFCPISRDYNFTLKSTYREFKYKENEIIVRSEAWFDRLFKYRWFYNSTFNLLGIYGVPESVENIFDGTCYFQNSCDQDYERIEWGNIEVFEKIYDKWQNVSDEVIINYMKEKGYTDDEIKSDLNYIDLNYYRRTAAYDEIWEPISNTLFDDDSITYLSIFGSWDIKYKEVFLKDCFEKAEKFFLKE